MNNLMVFENHDVEVFEWNGQVLFNPKHVGDCLGIKNVNDNISKMNNKQVIKLTNSKIGNPDFRKLHNTGENFLTESGVYKLIFKSKKKEAEKFQDWVTDEVLPQIRKTGLYQSQQNQINEFKGQLTTLVNDIFEDKLSEIKEYYKIKSKSKSDISSYIKKRLGILRADDEYEQVKARVFLLLGISKWEDLDVDSYKRILPIIDESIRIIKLDRPQQIGMWD
ncbi:BRO family protein [Clostridium tertium]|uniref:BRO-N domain-containing protein n=1 Tax=Clostridium TaxID=1485 RepID=UPI001FA86AE9|nr:MULTISPECIES: BRO family protein [Clostridium]MDB1939181.1 BRO family protein [Clostridium tertium]MDB1956350.1 BRO family protein [Clostridium tertium]MDB1959646.1 BRO family protein [Clostridium tertium]MDB1961558.1 BRO family protein [Clostridium tertium]MDB1967290.1 BRO family protein [Clostridium tertium]